MTADNQGNARRVLGETYILGVPYVRERDDTLDVRVISLDEVNGALGGSNGILERSEIAGIGDVGGGLSSNSQEGEVVIFKDFERNEVLGELGVLSVNVAGNDREREVGQEVAQEIIAVIEFVIPESHSIKTKLVESLRDLFALVDCIEQGSLCH